MWFLFFPDIFGYPLAVLLLVDNILSHQNCRLQVHGSIKSISNAVWNLYPYIIIEHKAKDILEYSVKSIW